MNNKRILVIAGSDSSGGAGLEADQKVIAAHGCYAMTATTALTVQNTQGVFDTHHTPAPFVARQIEACVTDIGVDVIKTGMLASAETILEVAKAIREFSPTCPTVIDPVMTSTSGSQLLPSDAVSSFREHILPLTTVLTPNIPEAKLLLCKEHEPGPHTQDEMVALTKDLHKLGSKYVLLKGGHLTPVSSKDPGQSRSTVDVLYDGREVIVIKKPFLSSRNTHAAIACNVALGQSVPDAVRNACQYVEAGIKTSIDRGQGPGPINHFHSIYTLPFAQGRFLDYLLARSDVQQIWKEHTEHSFVQQLSQGTLPLARFKNYLVQDYLFLIEFARAKSLSGYKTRMIEGIAGEAEMVLHIKREMNLHITYCESFGLTKQDIEASRPAQACLAYTSYVHDVGHTEDWFALQIAFAPCLIGYGMIARRLYDSPETVRGEKNRYWQWIENYVAADYVSAVTTGAAVLEKYAVMQSPSRIEDLVHIFKNATQLETGFWDIGQNSFADMNHG